MDRKGGKQKLTFEQAKQGDKEKLYRTSFVKSEFLVLAIAAATATSIDAILLHIDWSLPFILRSHTFHSRASSSDFSNPIIAYKFSKEGRKLTPVQKS